MNANYDPNDAELLKQDMQNQFMAIYNAQKLKSVDPKVNHGRGIRQVSATIRRMLASLTHKAQFVACILGRSVRHS